MRETITAKEAVERYGESLISKEIDTVRYGAWPGGISEVIELAPDPKAPEIAFMVRGLNIKVDMAVTAGRLDGYEIGVFEDEQIGIDVD